MFLLVSCGGRLGSNQCPACLFGLDRCHVAFLFSWQSFVYADRMVLPVQIYIENVLIVMGGFACWLQPAIAMVTDTGLLS